MHLLVEADNAASLRSGVQGLATRLARALNRAVGRRGKVWAERYHRHDLRGPTEVRRALVYVLQNGRKHGVVPPGALDPMSSVGSLTGWNARGARLVRALSVDVDSQRVCVATPYTWLLREGWRQRGGGELDPNEQPRSEATRHAERVTTT